MGIVWEKEKEHGEQAVMLGSTRDGQTETDRKRKEKRKRKRREREREREGEGERERARARAWGTSCQARFHKRRTDRDRQTDRQR